MQEVAPAGDSSGPAPPCSIGSTSNISTVGIRHAMSKCLHATRAADKLSLKTVVDMNSGVCTGELSWHVRLDGQPARLAVKLSNKHHTRVGFDLQVALRSPRHVLRLAGNPQGINSASLFIKPQQALAITAGGPDMATSLASQSCTAASQRSFQTKSSGSHSNRCRKGSKGAQNQVSSSAAGKEQRGSCSKRPDKQRVLSTGRQSAVAPAAGLESARSSSRMGVASSNDAAAHSCRSSLASSQHRSTAGAVLPQQPADPGTHHPSADIMQADTTRVGLQCELGWNWKAGGPVLALSKQLNTMPSTETPSPLAVQQLKAGYDAKGRSLSLTAGGAGWSIAVVLPSKGQCMFGLVPAFAWAPKVTVSLIPQLTNL